MIVQALSSEALKIRTTRVNASLAGVGLLLVAVFAVATAASYDPGTRAGTPLGEQLVGMAGVTQLFAMIIGILLVTSEFRHGTISASLLLIPDRRGLFATKVCVGFGAGITFGVVALAIAVLAPLTVLALRGIEPGFTPSLPLTDGVGNVVATAMWAGLGVGIGGIVRNQVGAIVGALAYVFVVESLLPVIPSVGDAVQKFGLNGLTLGLAPSEQFGDGIETIGQLPAGLLLGAYVLILAVAGAAMMQRTDITE